MMHLAKLKVFLNLAVVFLIVTISPTAWAEVVTVVHVCDGDTIILSDKKHVRYIGINAPEISHDMKPPEYFGNEAREFNKKLVLGKRVRLAFDQERQDAYGRILAYVYLEDGTFVNAELVKEGFVHVLYVLPNVKHYESLLNAQQKAIEKQKGMWTKVLATGKGPYRGNVGTKKFHSPTCPFGKRISAKNSVLFKTKKEAFMNGYSPCRRCRPSLHFPIF